MAWFSQKCRELEEDIEDDNFNVCTELVTFDDAKVGWMTFDSFGDYNFDDAEHPACPSNLSESSNEEDSSSEDESCSEFSEWLIENSIGGKIKNLENGVQVDPESLLSSPKSGTVDTESSSSDKVTEKPLSGNPEKALQSRQQDHGKRRFWINSTFCAASILCILILGLVLAVLLGLWPYQHLKATSIESGSTLQPVSSIAPSSKTVSHIAPTHPIPLHVGHHKPTNSSHAQSVPSSRPIPSSGSPSRALPSASPVTHHPSASPVTHHPSSSPVTQHPTTSPTHTTLNAKVKQLLKGRSAVGVFLNITTPQGKAFATLVNQSLTESLSEERILQRFALLTLYFSTNPNHWKHTSGWKNVTDDECGWYGISRCNVTKTGGDALISKLKLASNNLSGSIPNEICLLSQLKSLNLSGNTLNGTIPSCLGQLSNLVTLALQHNRLTGNISSTICDLGLHSFTTDCKKAVLCDCCTSCYS